jgi:hypothetical protein
MTASAPASALSRRHLAAAGLGAALLAGAPPLRAQGQDAERPLAASMALQAAIYGIPLLGMQQRLSAEVLEPATRLAPFNAFHHYRELATPDRAPFRAPNNDTLYSTAWLDLRREPAILSAPATGTRYWNAQVMDTTSDTIANLGQGRFGNAAVRFALVGPRWNGTLPDGLAAVVRSPTSILSILLRVLVEGPEDVAAVNALQDGFRIASLSRFAAGRDGADPPDREVLTPWAARDAAGRFAELDAILKRDPVRAGEGALLDGFALLGVGPGRTPWRLATDEALLARAEAEAAATARQAGLRLGRFVHGWRIITDGIGTYGHDYLQRAAVWEGGPLANVPEESLYPSAVLDAAGQPLDGATGRYLVRFPPGALPPVEAFWSLTMYERESGRLVANPIGRYAIGNRTRGLVPDADGGLTLAVQHGRPEGATAANWLPAPAAPFYMTLRLYRPREAVRSGAWLSPPIERLA